MKRLAARRYAGLLILSPTAAADPDSQPADCTQVNILLHVFSSQAQDSARLHRMGREEEMDKKCVCVCVCVLDVCVCVHVCAGRGGLCLENCAGIMYGGNRGVMCIRCVYVMGLEMGIQVMHLPICPILSYAAWTIRAFNIT